MIRELKESIPGLETVSESPLKNAERFCQASEHPLMLTLKAILAEEEEKVAHPTISPCWWHHQNCYWDDHLRVVLQRSSIWTRIFL